MILEAILILVGVSARGQLFCRSRNFIETFQHPTPFCTITGTSIDYTCTHEYACYWLHIVGIVLYYIVMHLLLWWLWHIIAVFWAVAWPLNARKFNSSGNTKYTHIAFALASLLLPIGPVLVILFVSSTPERNGGFRVTRAPPFLCTGYDIHINFWGFIFPITIVLATGAMFLVFTMRIVIKVCHSKRM